MTEERICNEEPRWRFKFNKKYGALKKEEGKFVDYGKLELVDRGYENAEWVEGFEIVDTFDASKRIDTRQPWEGWIFEGIWYEFKFLETGEIIRLNEDAFDAGGNIIVIKSK